MGTSLSGLTPATTFDGLLKVGDNDPLTADLKAISDGSGNDSALQLSTGELKVGGQFNVDTDGDLTSFNLRGNGLNINQIYHANETTYNTIAMANSAGISMKNGTGTALLVRGGNVGIGGITATPTARLQVNGSGATSATTSLLVQNSAGTDLFSIKDDGLFTLNDNGGGDALTIENGSNISQIRYNDNLWLGSSHGAYAPTIKIDRIAGLSVETTGGSLLNLLYDTGNLGIGETTPTARLHIKGSGNDNTTTSLLVQNSDGDDLIKVTDDSDVTLSKLVTIRNSSAGLFARAYADGYGAGGPLMWVNGSMNLGSSPSTAAKLSIKGSGNDNTTTALLVQNSDGADALKVTDDGIVKLGTTGQEGRINLYRSSNGGNVGIIRAIGNGLYLTNGSETNQILISNSAAQGIAIGSGNISMNATLGIKGSGNDATTTALLVQNSDGLDMLKLTDDSELNLNFAGQTSNPMTLRGAGSQSHFIEGGNDLTLGYSFIKVPNSAHFAYGAANKAVGVGTSSIASSTKMHIKGGGATSATTALLVENSAGTDLLIARDNNLVSLVSQNYSFSASQATFGKKLAIGVTANQSSAVLEIASTTQGFLPPRMTDAERDAITSPAPGLMIYDTSNNQMNYWNGTAWIAF